MGTSCILWLLLGLVGRVVTSPITIPLTPEGEVDDVIPPYFGSKKTIKAYHKLSPNESYAVLELDSDLHDPCMLDLKLQWSVNTGTAIYSTPVIFPSGDASDMKNIFISSYFNYIELIQGDGRRPPGWPLSFEDSSFQTSPLIYDIDNDGHTDIGVVDREANLYWIRTGEFGTYLEDYHIQVPQLRVLKDWYKTIDGGGGAYVMISMFDRVQEPIYLRDPTFAPSDSPGGVFNMKGSNKNASSVKHAKLDALSAANLFAANERRKIIDKKARTSAESAPVLPPSGNTRRRLLEEEGEGGEEQEQHDSLSLEGFEPEEGSPGDELEGLGGDFPPPISPSEETDDGIPHGRAYAYAAAEEGLDADGERFARSADDGISYYMSRRYSDRNGDGPEDPAMVNERFVNVDPHVLASPAMGDINGDGHMEVIFPVSYYFDPEKDAVGSLPADIDKDMYVASGLVCWDMAAQEWAWTVHLDLTTTKSKFQGLMYASPTIADLDGDKRMEVIVGTSLGMLYVVDGESGFVRHHFPQQFHSIQAQVAVADLMGGLELEMIVCDMGGSVIVLNQHGDVLWDRHLSGTLPYTATVGDVDGDGVLDVIVVAVIETQVMNTKKKVLERKVKSHLWALKGDTGATIAGFPLALPQGETISGPIVLLQDYGLLTKLIEQQQVHQMARNGLFSVPDFATLMKSGGAAPAFDVSTHSVTGETSEENTNGKAKTETAAKPSAVPEDGVYLLIPGFKGHVYVLALVYDHLLQRQEFCVQTIDVGSPMAASPLLEDVTGDGYLDLVLATLQGEVLVYETNMPRHAGNIWSSFPRHRGMSFSAGDLIISVPEEERHRLQRLDSRSGKFYSVNFDLFDMRCSPSQHTLASNGRQQPNVSLSSAAKYHMPPACSTDRTYTVTATKGSSKLEIVWAETFRTPGRYTAHIPINGPEITSLLLTVTTEHGLYSEDTVAVAVATTFYVWIKYFLLLPVVLLCILSLGRVPVLSQ